MNTVKYYVILIISVLMGLFLILATQTVRATETTNLLNNGSFDNQTEGWELDGTASYDNNNYGWPLASYGTRYGYQHNEDLKYKKNHKINGFTEPIYSFVPSVGLSQLINVEKGFNSKWENNILLTSLKGESIFRLTMDDEYSRIISKERIIINERIRDIVYDNKNKSFYLLLEDSGSLGVLKSK